jgi:hypothetical protein
VPQSPGGGCTAQPGRIAVLPGAGHSGAGGRSLASGTGSFDVGLSPCDPWGFRQPAVSAARGEHDCLAVVPAARSPARASALARTTSGSRGPGGRTSCHGRSCRARGRWIRICCTASHLPGQPPHPGVADGGQPGPVGLALRERYGFRPPWRVTRRWLPGGVSLDGGRSPEGATGPAECGVRGSGLAAGPARSPRCG